VAIRMGPPGSSSTPSGGRLGWLKWREFGRRGDTARDQVIQVLLELKCALVVPPSWFKDSKAGPSPTLGFQVGGRKTSRIRPLIREDYPLSLSISLSGGEETNQDFPSNGERTGKSPA
jgi:hypothetical protein